MDFSKLTSIMCWVHINEYISLKQRFKMSFTYFFVALVSFLRLLHSRIKSGLTCLYNTCIYVSEKNLSVCLWMKYTHYRSGRWTCIENFGVVVPRYSTDLIFTTDTIFLLLAMTLLVIDGHRKPRGKLATISTMLNRKVVSLLSTYHNRLIVQLVNINMRFVDSIYRSWGV